MSILSRLFGGSKSDPGPEIEAIEYEGFRIFPEPMAEGSTYRLSARIEKDVDGEIKTHHLIRADTLQSHGEAVSVSIAKAKQMIDEQGTRLFD